MSSSVLPYAQILSLPSSDDEVNEGEKALMGDIKRHIFVAEPYGCEAIEFYILVFGANELNRVYEEVPYDEEEDVRVISSELQMGLTSIIVVSEVTARSSVATKTKGINYVYMEDVDAAHALALELGARDLSKSVFPASRSAAAKYIMDPYNNIWCILPAFMMSCDAAEGSSKDPPTPQDIPKETDVCPEDIPEETEEIHDKKKRFF